MPMIDQPPESRFARLLKPFFDSIGQNLPIAAMAEHLNGLTYLTEPSQHSERAIRATLRHRWNRHALPHARRVWRR